jgi:gliding motility-associated-like protein
LPAIGTTTGSATITLIFYHNGIPTGYTLVSPVLTANGSYSFVVDPSSIPCNGSGYDIVARADFTILSSSYSLFSPDPMTTDGIKPGQNNDLVCCETLGQICDSTDVRITSDSGCCYWVEISNQYSSSYFTGISIKSDNSAIANLTVSPGNTWSTIAFQNTNQVVFSKTSSSNGIPLNGLTGFQPLGTICFAGTGPSNITINFIGPAPKYDTICPKIFNIECSTPIDTTCAAPIDLKAECNAGAVKMKFRIKNNSGFTMRGLTLYSQTPGVTPSPKFIPIPDLLPGQVSLLYYETTLIVSNNATNACFFIAACDQNTEPGDHGQYPKNCCMDSIPYCVSIPHCDPCDGISFTRTKNDPVKCCYSLSLNNNYYNANIAYLEFTGVAGTQFALFTGSGWTINGWVSSSHVKIKASGGGVVPGVYPDFASFCLTGTSTPPHTVLIKSMDARGVLLCTDTLKFDSCQLVTPTCANIINDSLYCSGNKIKYTFYVKNNAPFTLYQIDFRTTDKSVVLDSNYTQPHPPIATGNTGGPFTVTLDSVGKNLDRFCMYLTGHNAIYDSAHGIAATECCTDSLGVICLPMITCGSSDTAGCCSFENMKIPNGITPNEDGKNDVFEILNSKVCDYISIKVYNRWGNMVYQNGDYKNDWKGVNQKGQKVAQGTYFIVIELPNGNKKGIYIDIRY